MRSRASSAESSLAMPTAVVTPGAPATAAAPARSDLDTLKRLFPYLWDYKWRVLAALTFMVCAKLGNVGVPLLLKSLVDAMNLKPGNVQAVLVVPAALLLGYGLLRLYIAIYRTARTGFCQGDRRCIAQDFAGSFQAPARVKSEVPSGATDWRHDAGH